MSSSEFAYGAAREPDSSFSPNIFYWIEDSFEGKNSKQESGMDFDYFKWTNTTWE